ncbi:MAG TPA: hypothetical protein VK658_28440, partial [Chryseolinea sp.]|nr:hypothetical protein [Chryseolinea sp.]
RYLPHQLFVGVFTSNFNSIPNTPSIFSSNSNDGLPLPRSRAQSELVLIPASSAKWGWVIPRLFRRAFISFPNC